MENHKQNANVEANQPAPNHATGWARWAMIGGLGLVAIGGIGVAGAIGQDFGAPRFEQAAWGGGWGGGDGPRGWHGPRHGGMGFGGPGRIISELDLTDEQEDKIFAIMDRVRGEARPLMREFRDTREDLTELLSAATVDRAAVETLRADRIAKMDAASRTFSAALVEAAEVLTPEQRTKLADLVEEMGPRGRR